MVYILELKTTQASAIKIVTDAINSLLTDANFDFYPYYIENNDSKDDSSDSENDSNYESDSDNESSENKKTKEKNNKQSNGDKKTIGGVILKEVNKTGKILVYMRLDADKFEVYKYNYHKKKLSLGIDIGNLLKCLKCMSHFDTMTWLVDDEDINKLIVVLESAERKEKKTFKLNLMDIEEETYDISPIQFPYSITLPSQDFHKYCKDMASSTDKIEIKATSNKLFFSGKGEIGNIEFEVGETIELAPYIEDITSNYKGVIRDYIFKKSINSDKSVVAFGYGSMYNHSDIPNASWKVNDNHVKISCIKPINKDEEIFLSYGSQYWSSRNLDKKS